MDKKVSGSNNLGSGLIAVRFSFQQGSCLLRCWYLEARNDQNLNSPGFHTHYKTNIAIVCSIMNSYPLTCFHHRCGIMQGQQFHPIGRIDYLAYNASFLISNDPRCQIEKGDHTSVQNSFHIDWASDWTTGKSWSNLMFVGRSLEKEKNGLFLKAHLIDC